ncbi:hypothetical protein LOC71_11105 [Rhodopirellula sp. JC740]|uniref:Uncharacterized protein n=1 Tax=Rhodopirellula halodulae TaxID=2894198 RepID=A0ABS8NGY4_9BACT|nr:MULTISPECIES: hypothetical protein [unclassified Rhodopirellula]MCC9642824.1 hypothetical protein [Rhodopirellula sp. JC740]MCC9656199.1 hypothetical protein [Rhodopirellula sp. JC737]
MSDFKHYSTSTIANLISDTETTLAQLKAEMQRREAMAQEVQIEGLENHMKSAEFSLKSIREFLAFLIEEYRKEKPS